MRARTQVQLHKQVRESYMNSLINYNYRGGELSEQRIRDYKMQNRLTEYTKLTNNEVENYQTTKVFTRPVIEEKTTKVDKCSHIMYTADIKFVVNRVLVGLYIIHQEAFTAVW